MNTDLLKKFQAQPTPPQKAEAVCFYINIQIFIFFAFSLL
jgi:hypothetical protein